MSHYTAWYDDQPFAIGDRVAITDAAEQASVEGSAGRVVGYDAAGPRRGEPWVRVLVLVDGIAGNIAAIPPAALAIEFADERVGVAKTMLVELERTLAPEPFARLREWLGSDVCAALIADPQIGRKNVQLGTLAIPGFLLAELRQLATDC